MDMVISMQCFCKLTDYNSNSFQVKFLEEIFFPQFHLTRLANICSTVHVQLIQHQYDGRKVLSGFFEAFQLFCKTLAPY